MTRQTIRTKTRIYSFIAAAGAMVAIFNPQPSFASSHREAPFITENPKVDGTDFYMFRSYEAGRDSNVVLIADYLPLQDAYGGPNYFSLDPEALYEIHIDNNGDAKEDLTFQFRFQNSVKGLSVPVGGMNVPVPLINIGGIGPGSADTGALNVVESYTVSLVRGDRRKGDSFVLTNALNGESRFAKPVDNIGNKSIGDYATYADNHIYDVNIPGCDNGRLFVGQRKEPFVVNLGEIFDLVNVQDPIADVVGDEAKEANTIDDKNITSLILEVPISCLTAGDPVIGGWTTASLRQARVINPRPQGPGNASIEGGAFTQVSRLGLPLVNEVGIGLPDKDRFNASRPQDDTQFASYVTHPTLPALLEILFGSVGVQAPKVFPRNDLVTVLLTGVDGLNKPANVVASEMLRLNTGIGPVGAASQNNLGVIGGDNAGFPNGRRPGDDVVDVELRVFMGLLFHAFPGAFSDGDPTMDAPSGLIPFTDGATVSALNFDETFPYLRTPIPGSPN